MDNISKDYRGYIFREKTLHNLKNMIKYAKIKCSGENYGVKRKMLFCKRT